MFEELKKDLLVELKNKIIELDNDKTKLGEELSTSRKQSLDYSNRTFSLWKESEYQQYITSKSKIYKFFNKKKYISELETLKGKIKEDLIEKHNSEESKIKEIEKNIKKKEDEIKNVVDNIAIVEKSKRIEELPIDFSTAQELLLNNNININNYSVDDILKLGMSNQTSGNVEFMKKAVGENPFYIIYDNTNDFDFYYDFINNLNYNINGNSSLDVQNKEYFENYKKSVLDFLTKSKNGEIFIKPIQILEVIRFYFKDTIMYENGALGEGNYDDIYDAVSRVNQVINNALKLSIDDYHQLEEMYNPNDNNYYCHRTGTPGLEETIFENGLSISSQGTGNRYIVRNARKVDCFLAMAGYHNFYAGNGIGDARIILEIPKNESKPIGSNTIDGNNTFVLPQYVMASLYDGVNSGNKTVLHINNHQKDVDYKYLYNDGYDMNNPGAIENGFYNDNNKGMGR